MNYDDWKATNPADEEPGEPTCARCFADGFSECRCEPEEEVVHRDVKPENVAQDRECNAGVDGGCGACEKCDPAFWLAEARKEIGQLRAEIATASSAALQEARNACHDIMRKYADRRLYHKTEAAFECRQAINKMLGIT